MAKQKINLVLLTFFSLTLLGAQPPSDVPSLPLDPKFFMGLTDEEAHKKIEEYYRQREQEREARNLEYLNLMVTEAWKNLLRVTEAQWKLIEPRYKKANDLDWEMWVGASRWGTQESFHWYKRSEGNGGIRSKALEEMTEGEKIAEELIELLEDPNSTDEQIRKKIDALHQARENARKALPKARKELAAVLTTPRQEAVFLIWGYID